MTLKLGTVIANKDIPIYCTKHSRLLEELKYENIQDIIGVKLNNKELEILDKIQKQKTINLDRVHKNRNDTI